MTRIRRHGLAVTCAGCVSLTGLFSVFGDSDPGVRSVAEVAASARGSVVIIDVAGRDGNTKGLGTGFVIRSDGAIATNLHVIGEARPIQVRFADDDQSVPATAVLGVDRFLDLAVIQIARTGLPTLPLGDSDRLHVGQPLVAIGNPFGFHNSVVGGVLSARRTIDDGRDMLQLAMPIEPGDSGGPVLDQRGNVVGIVTLKSSTTARIGFALPVNALKSLLANPHPVAMSSWLTIGALDAAEWSPQMGASWRQRAGRIVASEAGRGFGGRTLCLSTTRLPADQPFEVAVEVRLADESGAAGLAFHVDGTDQHYGFYPSGGKLRLTRFAGPDVFSWEVLAEVASEKYHPGRWNRIKVRVDGPTITGWVNDAQVIQTRDSAFRTGRIGLVKFREPTAEFRRFRFGRTLAPTTVPAERAEEILAAASRFDKGGSSAPDAIDALVPHAAAALEVLRNRAFELNAQAARLRELADRVHQRSIQEQIRVLFRADDAAVDLVQAALLIARLDNDELETEPYQWMINRIANDIRETLPPEASASTRLEALTRHMFDQLGFHGSHADYYDRANSYLNEVLDDREGLPITLSLVFMELARRLDLPVVGIGLPGHFVVRYEPPGQPGQLIDVYAGGKPMTRKQARTLVRALANQELRDEHLRPLTKRAIIVRMLHNLVAVAQREGDALSMLRYLDVVLILAPESGEDRWDRARLRGQTGRLAGALEDLKWILDHRPQGIDLQRVAQLRDLLRDGNESP